MNVEPSMLTIFGAGMIAIGASLAYMVKDSKLAVQKSVNLRLQDELESHKERANEAENFAQVQTELLRAASDLLGDHLMEGEAIDLNKAGKLALAIERVVNGNMDDMNRVNEAANSVFATGGPVELAA